jgi:hypothetical protein
MPPYLIDEDVGIGDDVVWEAEGLVDRGDGTEDRLSVFADFAGLD